MASKRLETTKDGRKYYRISVSRGYGKSPYSTRWYVPEGLSQKYIDRELLKVMRDFERQCENGEIKNRSERRELAELEAIERAKIKTFGQYVDQVFLPTVKIEKAHNTFIYYRNLLKNHILPIIGDLKISEIGPVDIKRVLISIQEKNIGYSAIRGSYITMKAIMKRAYLEDLIVNNPCDKVPKPERNKDELEVNGAKAFSLEELQYFMDCLEHESLQWRALIHLLIVTGLRRGEALGIKWKSLNYNDNSITIDNNVCYNNVFGLYETTPKSNKARTVYITNDVAELLKALHKAQIENGILSPYVFNQEGSVRPIHPCSVTTFFERFGKKYGIPDCHAHKLRHTFATLAITNGADIASISELLGHSNKSITLNMYTHADEQAQKKAFEVFANAIKAEGL